MRPSPLAWPPPRPTPPARATAPSASAASPPCGKRTPGRGARWIPPCVSMPHPDRESPGGVRPRDVDRTRDAEDRACRQESEDLPRKEPVLEAERRVHARSPRIRGEARRLDVAAGADARVVRDGLRLD